MAWKMRYENYDVLRGIVHDLQSDDIEGWEAFKEDCEFFRNTRKLRDKVQQGIASGKVNKSLVRLQLDEAYTGV